MKIKLILTMFVILLFCFLFFTNISLANDTIYINSVEDYIQFATNNKLFNGYENQLIVLNTDLDFQNQTVPIVSGNFKGIFDGQGHSFKNIKLESDTSYYYNLGLFEENWGLIKKIIIESGTITGNTTTGAICGKNCGIIEQCANFVNIEACHSIGGIVGWNEGQGVVRNCYNTGNITDLQPGSGGTTGFGGIVGYLYSGTVIDCYSIGIIAPERNHSKGNIIGTYYSENSNSEFVSNCFSLQDNFSNITAHYNEYLYCIQLSEFNKDFYSNLYTPNSFLENNSSYPLINMELNLNELPPLAYLSSNFEKNNFFENNYSNIHLIELPKNNNLINNNSIDNNSINNTSSLEHFFENILNDSLTDKTTTTIYEENVTIKNNADKTSSNFLNNLQDFSTENSITFFVFFSILAVIIFEKFSSYSKNKIKDELNPPDDNNLV